MYMKGKFRLQKIAALSLVFVLLMNTLTAALAPVFAMEMDTIPNILMDVGITDEAGNILDENQVEAGGISSSDKVLINYDWSLAGVTVQEGDSYTFQLPMQLEIKEQQQGSLLSGNQTEIGTYQVELDGSVAIQFNEAAAAEADASGSLIIKAGFNETVIGNAESADLLFQLAGNEKTIQVNFATAAAEVAEPTEVPGAAAEEPAAEEPMMMMAQSQALYTTGAITENIITNVKLVHRIGDTEVILNPGDEIVVDNPFESYEVAVTYNFALPDGHSYGAGSTYEIDIPDVFAVLPNPELNELKAADGTVFGTFIVTNDRKIMITFNENIENRSDISGFVTLFSSFDSQYDGLAETEITIPIRDGSSITYPIKFMPSVNAIDKMGVPDKAYNAKNLTWTVDFNKGLKEVENAIVTDAAAVGEHAFTPGSLHVFKLFMNADGTIDETKTVEIMDHGFGDAFPLNLGTIDSAYRLVYQTTITDDLGQTYKNNVTLSGSNQEPISAAATVTVKRGQPLEKATTAYNGQTQKITWQAKYNYDEKSISQAEAYLTDTFGSNQKLVSTTATDFNVYKVTINPDTGAEAGQELVTNYTVTPNATGFTLQFTDPVTTAYKIIYNTTSVNRVETNATISNTISDAFGNTKTATRNIGQGVLIKANDSSKTNYNAKTTGWTISLNGDLYTMTNVQVIDTLPVGFTPRDMVITHGSTTLLENTQYTQSYDPITGKITINFLAPVTEKVVIKFTTDINHDLTVPEANGTYKNSVNMTWTPDGTNGSGVATGSATFDPDTYTKANGFKGGSYNLATKVIDWKIGVNYNNQTLSNVVVGDVIQGNQNFDSSDIHVYPMNLTGSANGYTLGTELIRGTDYQVETFTGLTGEPAFRVKLGDIDSAYLISFQTDLQDELVAKTYTNTASVTTNTPDSNFELKATVSPTFGGEYTGKQAIQNAVNPRIVNWSVKINYAQSTVSNVVIKDTPSKNQAIQKESFKLYATTTTPTQINKGAALVEGVDYTLAFVENADGTETFTLTFLDSQIDRAYILEYNTYILFKDNGFISNDAVFTGDETEGVPTDSSVNQRIQTAGIAGGIDGKVGSLAITKVAAGSNAPLAGASFTLYDKTGQVALRTYVTGADGKAVFNNLLYGDYIVKETAAPEGYVVGIADQQTATVDAEVSTMTVTNKKIIRAVELTKTDKATGKKLAGAMFELQKKVGNDYQTIANLTTDSTGTLYRGDLEAGDYRFIELIAPTGYQKMTNPIPFTITEKQTEVTKVTAENLKLGSVVLTKFNEDNANETLAGAEFKLLSSDGSVLFPILRTDALGAIFVENLQPGSYSFVEIKAPTAFELNVEPIIFNVVAGETTAVKVNAPNALITGSVLLTKTDGTSAEALAGVTFTLYTESNQVIAANLTTDANGKIKVENLKPGNYYFVETKAATDYQSNTQKYNFTIARNLVGTPATPVQVNATNELIPGAVVLTKVDNQSGAVLANAVFDLQDAEGTVLQAGLVTDASGKISITDLRPGDYQLVETQAATYYKLTTDPIAFTIVRSQEEALQLTAENELIRGNVQLTKTDVDKENGPFAGAVFALQNAKGDVLQENLTTGTDGTILITDLLPGDYQLVETATVFGYDLDATPIPFTIKKAETLADVKTVEVSAENELTTGSVELSKTDLDNEGLPLAGVTFSLQDATGKVLQADLVTDENGKIIIDDLKPGDYQFVETATLFGYDLDATPIPFTIILGPTETVLLEATNELTTGSVELSKTDLDNEGLPLAGVSFALQDATGKVLQADLMTDENGKIIIDDLKPGDYQFVETATLFGYDLDATPIPFTIEKAETMADVKTVEVTAENELTTGSVELSKTDLDNEGLPLAGVTFSLQDATGKVLQADLVTDENGKIIVDDLKPGNYQFVETATLFGYDLDATPIPFTIILGPTEEVMVEATNELTTGSVELSKTDLDNEGLPLAGVTYSLQDATGNTLQADLVTDENGKIIVDDLKPGDYQFVETATLFGYDLDATPIPFTIVLGPTETVMVEAENELTTGSVELIKVDRDNGKITLENVVFELRNAEGKLLQSELTTDKDGRILVSDLKPGDYQFIETKAPFGYDLDATPILFTIEKGQIETIIKTATNELTTGSVSLIKVDKLDPSHKLMGAEFSVTNEAGAVLFEGLKTDKDGKLMVENLKPGNYFFVETKAPQHYQLDKTPLAFTIVKGQEMTLTVMAKNDLITGGVVLTKVDAAKNDKVLAGAHFELQDSNGKVIRTDLVTDKDGKIWVNDLLPGDYQFVETQAPKGYERNTKPVTFTIDYSQKTVAKVTAENKKIVKANLGKEVDKGSTGSVLPDTATNTFNYLLAGIVLLAIGFFTLRKKKTSK